MATSEAQVVTPTNRPSPRLFARPVRALPELERRTPLFWFTLAAVTLGCAGFVMHATNAERATSSVMRQIIFEMRRSDEIYAALGDNVQPEPGWFVYGGYPQVEGSMSVLQGKVDISFRIRGSKGAGTVYFTSIRKNKGQKFLILRFRVVCDDGTILSLRENYEDGGLLFERPPS